MKCTNDFSEWQRDLSYVAAIYDITSGAALTLPADIISRLQSAARILPEEVAPLLDEQTCTSMIDFLETTAGSMLEIQRLLKVALQLKLIPFSDYHSLNANLREMGDIIDNLLTRISGSFMDSRRTFAQDTGHIALLTLN